MKRAGSRARRRQRPAYRALQPGRRQPSTALAAVTMLMFTFALDETNVLQRVAPACLAGDAVQPARARPAGVRDRGRRRRARRAPGGGSRSGRRLLGQGDGTGGTGRGARGIAAGRGRAAVRSGHPRRRPGVAGRDARPSRRLVWHASVRCTAASPQGSRVARRCSRCSYSRGGTSPDRSNPSRRIRARHRWGGAPGRLAVGHLLAVFAVAFGVGGALAFGPDR